MSTAVSKNKSGIRDMIQSDAFKQAMAETLPKHMDADRMSRIAIACLTKTPKLKECDPNTLLKCLIDLSSWGLEPDGRHAHLIPYGKDCTLILDYKGIVKLAYQSGFVLNIHTDVIYEGDLFEFSLGKVTKHSPWAFLSANLRAESKGEVIGAYCIVEMKNGAAHHEVMTRDEIESIRSRSRAGKSGPWVTDWTEMARKTVFRRASKWLPLSSEQQAAFDRDFDSFEPIRSSRRLKVTSEPAAEFLSPPEGLFEEQPMADTAPEDA